MGNEVKKENHSKGLVIAILIILVEIVIGFIAYNKTISNNDKNNTQESQVENNKDNTDEIENNKIDGIVLYNGKKGDKYYLYENKYLNSDADEYEYEYSSYSEAELKENNSSNKYNKIGEYICKHDGCDVLSVVNKKYALIYDSEYFIYDIEEKNINTHLNIEKVKYSSMNVIENNNNNIAGIILNKEGKTYYSREAAYYDVKKQKITIDFGTYTDIYTNKKLLERNFIIAENGETFEDTYKSALYDIVENKIVNDKVNSSMSGNNVIYYLYSYEYERFEIERIYDSNQNLIFESKNSDEVLLSEDFYITEDDKLIFTDHNRFYIYGNDYKLEYTSEQYEKIYNVFKDYVLVNANGYLKLLDYKGNEKAQFTKIDDNIIIHTMLSGWYTENDKNGIYVVVEDTNIPYGTEGSGAEYYYIPSTEEIGVIKTDGVGGYAKPVLYSYPENDNTKVKVEFEKPELLTTTYPKYVNSWSVIANKNGDLKDKNGKYYYGLYWEEEGNIKVDFKEGFYVEKGSAIKFLEEKLDAIGLNEREANEFIMYWLPILEKNEKNLVYFELTEERQKFNRIDILPKPDSLLRIAIHVKKVDTKRNIKPQKFTKFKRSGFTAIEWGGTIH